MAMRGKVLEPLGQAGLVLAEGESDLRGRRVLDRDGEEIGHVADLFVDETERKVRLLHVKGGGFLGIGDAEFLVPVDAITSVSGDTVRLGRPRLALSEAPRYEPELVEVQDYWPGLYTWWGYGYPAFFGPVAIGADSRRAVPSPKK